MAHVYHGSSRQLEAQNLGEGGGSVLDAAYRKARKPEFKPQHPHQSPAWLLMPTILASRRQRQLDLGSLLVSQLVKRVGL